MATRGGLEIHMELAHAAPKPAPVAAIAPQPVPAMPQGAVPHRRSVPARAPAIDWQLPRFLRGIDATLPLTALLVVALFVAGVGAAVHRGAGTKPIVAGAQGTPPAAATAPPLVVDPAADTKLAQSLVLTQIDYPDGWTVVPHAGSTAVQAENDQRVSGCLGLPNPATTHSADAFGPDGHPSGAVTAATRVVALRTPQQAAAEFAAIGGTAAIPCLKDEITRSFSAGGAAVSDVAIGRFALSTGNVPSVALHAEVALATGQGTGVIHLDAVFLRQGRIEGEAVFASGAGEFPVDTEQTLVTRFAHKIASA